MSKPQQSDTMFNRRALLWSLMGVGVASVAACTFAVAPTGETTPSTESAQRTSLWFEAFAPANPTKTIVFLHGLGLGSWMWQKQVALLRETYHCLLIDLPGNGESYQVEWTSMADAASQVAEIIRQQAIGGRAHIVGLSLGGYVAMQLLANQPEVVESMVVSGINVRAYTAPWFWRTLFTQLVPLMKREAVLQANARTMGLPDDLFPLMQRDMNRVTKTTYARVFNETFRQSMPAVLGERQQRVLGVAGDQEDQPIRAGLPDFPTYLPNGKAALVADAHHVWNGQHPERFTEMVRSWVENTPLPPELQVV